MKTEMVIEYLPPFVCISPSSLDEVLAGPSFCCVLAPPTSVTASPVTGSEKADCEFISELTDCRADGDPGSVS